MENPTKKKPSLVKAAVISLLLALIPALIITIILAVVQFFMGTMQLGAVPVQKTATQSSVQAAAAQAAILVQPTPVKRPTMLVITATPRPTFPPEQKRIFVDISEQRLTAYQGEEVVYHFVISSGAKNNTPLGEFQILDKVPDAYSDSLGFAMPFWLGFTWIGIEEDGIHGLPVLQDGRVLWGDELGLPVTTGCIVLSTTDAQLLYNWAEVGVTLQIVE